MYRERIKHAGWPTAPEREKKNTNYVL